MSPWRQNETQWIGRIAPKNKDALALPKALRGTQFKSRCDFLKKPNLNNAPTPEGPNLARWWAAQCLVSPSTDSHPKVANWQSRGNPFGRTWLQSAIISATLDQISRSLVTKETPWLNSTWDKMGTPIASLRSNAGSGFVSKPKSARNLTRPMY